MLRQPVIKKGTPTILACNHPNSFLDAIIIGAYHPVTSYFLARGDAFKKPLVKRILAALKMIPIYRLSEGKELLSENENSFQQCLQLLREDQTLLIFPEGICVNKEAIQPLKKGTARIAARAWHHHDIEDLVVQTVHIKYNSFNQLPKNISIVYGNTISKADIHYSNEANFYNDFNDRLYSDLQVCSMSNELLERKGKFIAVAKIFLIIPALIGFLLNYWFYKLCQSLIRKKTIGTVFYDSALFAVLMITYPILVLLVSFILVAITNDLSLFLLIVLFPLSGWCYKEWKAVQMS